MTQHEKNLAQLRALVQTHLDMEVSYDKEAQKNADLAQYHHEKSEGYQAAIDELEKIAKRSN